MKIKYLFLLILFLFLYTLSYSQLEIISQTELKAKQFCIDKLGFFYLVDDNSIIKTDNNMKQLQVFDNKKYGSITSIDVSDPMRILIYFQSFNSLLFVDNYLNDIGKFIALDQLNIYNAGTICTSFIGSFRVYDIRNSNILLYDKQLSLMQTSINLFSILKNQDVVKLRESNNYLAVLFSSGQLVILDKFGSFCKIINNEKIVNFDFINDIVYYISDKHFVKLNSDFVQERMFNLDIEHKYIDFALYNEKLYLLTENKLLICKLQ